MSQRLDHFRESPEIVRKLAEANARLKEGPLGANLLELVNIRVSLLNGCAFCLDMHVKVGKLHGERELRMFHVPVWRESPLFDERERAALEWAETLTHLPAAGVSDELYERMLRVFSTKELSDLSYGVSLINVWNRMQIAVRAVPGSADRAQGVTNSGLS